MVCLVRNILHEIVGKSKLEWEELEGALTDIETRLRNIPLTSIKEDIQFPVLTPNLLVLGRNSEGRSYKY